MCQNTRGDQHGETIQKIQTLEAQKSLLTVTINKKEWKHDLIELSMLHIFKWPR